MARQFLTPIDLQKNELQNARVQNLASAPSTPVAGQIYWDSTNNALYIYTGSTWRPADAAKLTDGTIQNTALATNPLARANHTGTQLSATISDLAATVQAYKLNQFAAPNANIPMGGFTLTGLPTPNAGGQAAEYNWVVGQIQSAAAGIASKDPVNVVSTTNQATLSGLLTIDGVTLVAGNRVLLVGQTTASQNGVWIASAGAWARSTQEGATNGELDPGALWLVLSGTANAGTQWRMATTGAITVGTTSISIVQFSAANIITAGNGLTQVGNAFVVNPQTGGGLQVSGSGVGIDSTVAQIYATTLSTSATSYTVTHNLGTQDVHVSVMQAATPWNVVDADIAAPTTNTVTVGFATAPAANTYRVTVLG